VNGAVFIFGPVHIFLDGPREDGSQFFDALLDVRDFGLDVLAFGLVDGVFIAHESCLLRKRHELKHKTGDKARQFFMI